jgi:hypothetical protein
LEAAAQAAANQKVIAVPFSTSQDLSVKQQATILEYNLQAPTNTEGEIRNNPKVLHLKSLNKPLVRKAQEKIDYYPSIDLEEYVKRWIGLNK